MENELMHYGVPGMKWGVRKDRRYTDKEISEYRKRKIAEAPTKSESPRGANKGWYKNAPKSVLIRQMQREESEASKNEYKKAKKQYNAAKKERKNAIKETTKSLNKSASFGEKITYNNATRRKAAKYIVDNNMSIEQAKAKAEGDAWRNTAIMLGAYGSVALATLIVRK